VTTPALPQPLRERLLLRHGAPVERWLDGLPALAAALAERWGLALGDAPASGENGVVLRCRRADGRDAVLKLSPDLDNLAAEGAALAAWWGAAPGSVRPVPEVLAHDAGRGALLLEAVGPGHPLAAERRPPALERVAALLRALHADGGAVATHLGTLPRLGDRMAFLFELWIRRRQQSERASRTVPDGLLERGARAALALAGEAEAARTVLHADLHPGNVLDGGAERGLVAIDPRPCLGDPAFDALDWVVWRATERAEVERRIALLAPAVGAPPERLAEWCAAFAAMLAVSLARRDDGDCDERQLALLLELAV
jgi:streptomycin 6-kinase